MVEDVTRSLGHLALGTRLKRIGERLQTQTQRILDAYEMPIQTAQFPFLAAIDRVGPLTIGELADAVGVTQPAATRAAAQLEEDRLVSVAAPTDDQRRRVVTLTASGRRLVERGKRDAWPAIERSVKDLCRGLSGPLLDQLGAIEDGLAEMPLDDRAARARRR
jgi:DNA-binding MarR family transcriptional regulator